MGKPGNIRRDIARARPCRLCGEPVFIVQVDYRVVPSPYTANEVEPLDLVSMPTRSSMVLDRTATEDGFYIVNDDPNGTAGEGFVAYDPEYNLDAEHWGFVRYRGHDCPKVNDKRERAHGNRVFSQGHVRHPRLGADDASVGSGID
jgi:hypothetical protein